MFQKYKLLLPSLVLLTLSTLTYINSGADYSLTSQHYAGLTASIICIITFFAFKKYYKYVLGVTLLLGLINIFNFTPSQTTTSLNFNSLSIGFQPYSFLVIMLTLLLAIPKRSEVTIVKSENEIKVNQDQYKDDLEKFRKLYGTKSSVDLAEIIVSSKFTPAAKDAAKQTLDERQTEKGST